MYRLYNKQECPFCWPVRIALAEAKLPFQQITLADDDDRAPLRQLSPIATMPILMVNDDPIWESEVILEYLHDVTGDLLLPDEPKDRASARLLASYHKVLGKSLREIVFEKRAKPQADWDWQRLNEAEQGWRKSLSWLEVRQGDAEFFMTKFSIAECALFPRFALAEHYGVGVDERHPGLLAWYQNLKQRSSCLSSRPESW